MYRIKSGSTQGLANTAAFIERLSGLHRHPRPELREFFAARGELFVSRAPGRLDLMGGIADYSGSLVLELPLSCATHCALQLQQEETLRVASLDLDEGAEPRLFEMDLADLMDASGRPLEYPAAARYFERGEGRDRWASYVAGAFLVLMRERGHAFKMGARLLIASDVPEGKGVSSSAALEVAVMRAVAVAYDLDVSVRESALLCQKVENLVAGAPCGVMDQITSACGEPDRLLALLCQPAELKGTIKLPEELAVWGIDSGIRHSVGGADYRTVRTAAFMGYRMIAGMAGLAVSATGDVGRVRINDTRWAGYLANITPSEFEELYAARLPEQMTGAEFLERYTGITDTATSVFPEESYPVFRATCHPVYEHARVEAFTEILMNWRGTDQAEELGELMSRSHESYSACGLGSPGTDELVRLVRESGRGAVGAELYGAKITGGGGGGTVAVLGRRGGAQETVKAVAREYARRFGAGRKPLVLSGSSPGAGAFGHLILVGAD